MENLICPEDSEVERMSSTGGTDRSLELTGEVEAGNLNWRVTSIEAFEVLNLIETPRGWVWTEKSKRLITGSLMVR